MIRLKSKIKSFDLMSSFSDLNFEQYKELTTPNVSEFRQIEILTGLNEMEAVILDLESLSVHLEFLKLNPFQEIEPSDFLTINGKEIILPSDIGEHSWAQKIFSSQGIPDKDSEEEINPARILSPYVMPLLFETTFDASRLEETESILNRIPMDELFRGVNFIKDQLFEIAKRQNELLKTEITFEQKRAGIEMFNQLGEFNTIDLVAQGDVTKYDEVLKVDYNTILNKLYKLHLSAIFEKNYAEIMREKS